MINLLQRRMIGGLSSLENRPKQSLPSGSKDRGKLVPREVRVAVFTSMEEGIPMTVIHVWGMMTIELGGNLQRETTPGTVASLTFKVWW